MNNMPRGRMARLVTLAALLPLASGCSDPARPLAPPGPDQTGTAPPQEPPPPGPIAAGPDHIYLADATGDNVVRLSSGTTPAWSPDGRRIAFERAATIIVIDADGTNERPLHAGTWPTWSPDGARIAFTSSEGISVMNADGSDVKTLIRHGFLFGPDHSWDQGISKGDWSPDGALIAFEHLGDGDIAPAQVFVMNADGSNPRRFSVNGNGYRYAESDPAWSPDGSQLTYWSYGYGVAVANVRDGVPRSIYHNFPAVAYGAKPAWSPDGKEIAFDMFRYSASGITSVWVVPVTGGIPRVFLAEAHYLAWSLDGQRVAFVSNRPL